MCRAEGTKCRGPLRLLPDVNIGVQVLHGHIHGSLDEVDFCDWQDEQAGHVVPALSEHWKDVQQMVIALIGYGLSGGARTELVGSAGLEGMDLPRYRSAVRAARERAVRARVASELGEIPGIGNVSADSRNGNRHG